jgi:hypothetical protein
MAWRIDNLIKVVLIDPYGFMSKMDGAMNQNKICYLKWCASYFAGESHATW